MHIDGVSADIEKFCGLGDGVLELENPPGGEDAENLLIFAVGRDSIVFLDFLPDLRHGALDQIVNVLGKVLSALGGGEGGLLLAEGGDYIGKGGV